jgi:hypothetical protein
VGFETLRLRGEAVFRVEAFFCVPRFCGVRFCVVERLEVDFDRRWVVRLA